MIPRRTFLRTYSKTVIWILCLIFIYSQANAGVRRRSNIINKHLTTTTTNTNNTFLVHQDFETPTTGYDNGETWTTAGTGTLNPAYTAAPLVGLQSFNMIRANQNGSLSTSFSSQDEVWGYFRLKCSSVGSLPTLVCVLRDASNNTQFSVEVYTTSTNIMMRCGTKNSALGGINLGTEYHIWFHYKKGSGANAVAETAISTDGSKPSTPGTTYKIISDGTSTASVVKWFLGGDSNEDIVYVLDKVRIANYELTPSNID